jgi:hypothetical protein
MTRRIVLVALSGLVITAATSSAASAADVFGFKPRLGQGTTKFEGKTKFKAYAEITFRTMVDGVTCSDSLSLERRVREVVNHHFRFRWILIRGGDPLQRCQETPTGAKPAAEKSSLKFLNDPAPYKRVLSTTPLRLRYRVTVRSAGRVVFFKTLISPVTTATLSRGFRFG